MTNSAGWIKLHRQVMENELYCSERFSKTHAWIDLLLLANHRPTTIFLRGVEVRLGVGELAYSMQTLGKRWKWNKRTVKHFLCWLENRQMIHIRISNVTTLITILKYDEYQQCTPQSAPQSNTRMHTDNNDKNEKKKYTSDSVEVGSLFYLYLSRISKLDFSYRITENSGLYLSQYFNLLTQI